MNEIAMDEMKDYNENFSSFDDDPYEDYFYKGGCTPIAVFVFIFVAICLGAGILYLFT